MAGIGAESTVAKKGHDRPLLNTGVLRDSIQAKVIMSGAEHGRAVVGTDEMSGVYAELGTQHEPPRSFLTAAATQSHKELNKIVRKHIHTAWSSAGHDNSMLHALHALKLLLEVAREVHRGTVGKGLRENR
jgi:hypothetical protein